MASGHDNRTDRDMPRSKDRRQVIEEDLANVEFETSEEVEALPTFDTMGLREDLLRGIYAYGKNFNYFFDFFLASSIIKISLQVLKNHPPFNKEPLNQL